MGAIGTIAELSQSLVDQVHGDRKVHGLLTTMSNIDPIEGKSESYRIVTEFDCIRVFRKSQYIRYKNPIHEALYHTKTQLNLYRVPLDEVNILHDGYRKAVGSDVGYIVRGAKTALENAREVFDKYGS